MCCILQGSVNGIRIEINGKYAADLNLDDYDVICKLKDSAIGLVKLQKEKTKAVKKLSGSILFDRLRQLHAEMEALLDDALNGPGCENLGICGIVGSMASNGCPVWYNILTPIFDAVGAEKKMEIRAALNRYKG